MPQKQPPRRTAGVDAEEAEALTAAASVASQFTSRANAMAAATAIISEWITTRARLNVEKRLTETLVFGLGDARLIGLIQACLPQIGQRLAEEGFDFGKTFSDLSKDEAVQLFLAGVLAHRDAAVAQGESREFPFDPPFDDRVPFGALQDDEVPF